MKVMRKMRLFQRDAYISVDFAEKETEIFTLADTNDDDDALKIEVDTGGKFSQKSIRLDKPEILPVECHSGRIDLIRTCHCGGYRNSCSCIRWIPCPRGGTSDTGEDPEKSFCPMKRHLQYLLMIPVLVSACTGDELQPAFVHIADFEVISDPGLEGSPTQKITDAWVM